MGKISFSVDENEKIILERYAKLKGMKLSTLAKYTLFEYVGKYPRKGAELKADK